jgi:hypothetical protein
LTRAVTVRSPRSGRERTLAAQCFLDASELGDLLPLTGTEFVGMDIRFLIWAQRTEIRKLLVFSECQD